MITGPLSAAEALKRLHGFKNVEQLYNPIHKDRPLLPDRRNPAQAMPRRVIAIFIKTLGVKAADPMGLHLTPYSMRIGHATHLWVCGVPAIVAAKKFRWEASLHHVPLLGESRDNTVSTRSHHGGLAVQRCMKIRIRGQICSTYTELGSHWYAFR